MGNKKHELTLAAFPGDKLNRKEDTPIRDISEVNAHSTPKQISGFVSGKMKEFMTTQIEKKTEYQKPN